MSYRIALTILILGGLNWGSVGLLRFDAAAWLCGGPGAPAARGLGILAGAAAVWCIGLFRRGGAAPD